MKLLTKEVQKALPPLYSNEDVEDPIVHVKFFNPTGSATWWILEGEWRDENDQPTDEAHAADYLMFGLCMLFGPEEAELGYLSLNELKSVRGAFGLPMERDMYFTPQPLSKVKADNHIL